MSFKSMGYDHPTYTARVGAFTGVQAAGAAASLGTKFTAFANMLLFSLNVLTTTAGTSTFTTGLANNPVTATTAVASQQYNLLRITNTAASGTTAALSTTTYGPFTLGGNFTVSSTATNQAGAYNQFQIAGNGTTTASNGGVVINAGDQIVISNGTDTTAASVYSVDYSVLPLANVVA